MFFFYVFTLHFFWPLSITATQNKQTKKVKFTLKAQTKCVLGFSGCFLCAVFQIIPESS